jgi:hypothetical protein
MSNTSLSWAWPIAITGPKKAVLVALAEHADDHGICWPSLSRLALYSGVCDRAVRNAIRELEASGLIRTERSLGRTASRYQLVYAEYGAGINGHNAEYSSGITPQSTRNVVPINPAPHAANPESHSVNPAPHAPEPLEPSLTLKEPSAVREPPRKTRAASAPSKDDPEFVRFWEQYPRKEDKGHARKAWAAAIKKTTPEAILRALERQEFSPDPKFRPYPATWLNGERWSNEPNVKTPQQAAQDLWGRF